MSVCPADHINISYGMEWLRISAVHKCVIHSLPELERPTCRMTGNARARTVRSSTPHEEFSWMAVATDAEGVIRKLRKPVGGPCRGAWLFAETSGGSVK